MRKRNVHVQFWLDKKEAEAFNKKVKRSGLSREAYPVSYTHLTLPTTPYV